MHIKVTGKIGDFPKGSVLPVLGHVGYRFIKFNDIVYPLERYRGQYEVLED